MTAQKQQPALPIVAVNPGFSRRVGQNSVQIPISREEASRIPGLFLLDGKSVTIEAKPGTSKEDALRLACSEPYQALITTDRITVTLS